MSVTLSTLIERTARALGAFREVTTTSSADATSVIATALTDHFPTNDALNLYGWVRLPTGPTAAGGGASEEKRVTDYAASTGDATTNAFSATVETGVTAQVWLLAPDDVREAVKRAIRDAYPTLHQWVVDESLVVNSVPSNGGFETFSGGFTGWTEAGSPTVTQETTRVKHGSSSAKVVAGVAAGQLTQDLFSAVEVNEASGKTLRFKAWVWASAADTARLRVTFDGSTYTSSAYHDGSADWRLLDLSANVPDDATEITVVCEVAASGTAYFDRAWAGVGDVWRYTVPSTLDKVAAVTVQLNERQPEGLYVPLRGFPPAGHVLRLEGPSVLSQPTADTGTVEVNDAQADLIAFEAALGLAMQAPSRFREQIPYIQEQLDGRPGKPGLRQRARMPSWAQERRYWRVERGASGDALILTGGR